MYDMNHTTLALVAVLASAALVIGTLASPAFASDISKTITKQINKQKQTISRIYSEGSQSASNCIAILDGSNACRGQENGHLQWYHRTAKTAK
jgi:hypothetical protein